MNSQDLAGFGVLLALAPLIFFIFTVAVMIIVTARLGRAVEELQRLNRQMVAIRFPNLPWPDLRPDEIVATDWRDGVAWRLRGDGTWEHHRGPRWQRASGPP